MISRFLCAHAQGRRVRCTPALSLVCVAVASLLPFPNGVSSQQTIPIDSALSRPLLEAVSRSNPELLAFRSAATAALARARAVGFAPPVVLSGEVEDVPGGTDLTGAGFRLELAREFLTGGRADAARDVAGAAVAAAEAGLYAAELRTRAATATAVVEAVGWTAIARRLAEEDSLLLGAEHSLRLRFAVADARYTDVLRLRTERLRIQTDRAEAIAESHVGTAALEALLGVGPTEAAPLIRAVRDASPVDALPEELPPPPDLDAVLEVSGRVRIAEAELARARAEQFGVLAEQRPRIAGAIGAQRVEGAGGGFAVGPTLGFSVSLPFTAGRANHAAANAAEGTVAAAEASLNATRAEVRADLVTARTRYEAARERLGVFDAALLEGVRQEREGALAAYRNGELSLIELLDFERALARAEVERRRAQMDAVVSLIHLVSGAAGRNP